MRIPLELVKAVKLPGGAGPEPGVDTSGLAFFTEASEMARDGQYRHAELLVRQALGQQSALRPALWNLLAKIYAQQGQYLDAELCWREALALAPGNAECIDGLRAVARSRQVSPIAAGLKWGLALLLCALFGYFGMAIHDRIKLTWPESPVQK